MKKYLSIIVASLLLCTASASYASDNTNAHQALVNVIGSTPTTVKVEKPEEVGFASSLKSAFFASSPTTRKSVQLLRLSANAEFIKHFNQQVQSVKAADADMPTPSVNPNFSHDVGMNMVPVLDQGPYGTCATFANTAAIDAVLGQGDYVSQLCSLELGNELAKQDSEYLSGWNGSWSPIVIGQIQKYGIINKQMQKAGVCGKITSYPHSYSREAMSARITTDEFMQYREDVSQQFKMQDLLVLRDSPTDGDSINNIIYFHQGIVDGDKTLINVKKAIDQGNRVVSGVFLALDSKNGGVKDYPWDDNALLSTGGLWRMDKDIQEMVDKINNALTSKEQSHLFMSNFGGHEIIITGYDSTQYTDEGGLLKIRNSWGSRAGAHGEYFMTGDYFKTMAVGEAFAMIPTPSASGG